MPWRNWSDGQEVTATDFNNYVQQQAVCSFPDAATRDATWPTPPVGAMCTLATAPGVVLIRNASAWVPVNWVRYGAQANGTASVANAAVVSPTNWAGVGSTFGGATISPTAGVQLPTAPGLVAVSLLLTTPTAPAANQYVRATVVQAPGGFVQTQVFLGLSQTVGSAMNIFFLDQPGFSYNCQITHNLGVTVTISATIAAYKVGP